MTTTSTENESEHVGEPGPPAPIEAPAKRRPGLNTDTLALAGLFISMFAFFAAIFAVALAARSIDEHEAVSAAIESGAGGAVASAVTVGLQEFAITPGSVEVTAGSVLNVENEGTVPHNLSVNGMETPLIDGGGTSELDISGLQPGTYTMVCTVAGHEASGMKGTLIVT